MIFIMFSKFRFFYIAAFILQKTNAMPTVTQSYKSGNQLSAKSVLTWRIIQAAVWVVGLVIFLSLIFYPSLGLLLFWNILIPVAPALFVVAVGIWRNVCPLATTNLLPRHFNLSKRKKMSIKLQSKLQLVAILSLYFIVPLRHALLNRNGLATASLLTIAGITGFAMSFIFDWKSSWCSTLCPVHPVEKLYGGKTLVSMPNAHCEECVNCSVPCPDSTPSFHPSLAQKTIYHKIGGILTIGGLPGFIWGWFHVPDQLEITNWYNFLATYQLPLIGLVTSSAVYLFLQLFLKGKNERTLINVFAASGVSCYYWYRLPALFGFGSFADDGLLINLKNVLPSWSIIAITIATTLFFFWWIVLRKTKQKSWVVRPEYAAKHTSIDSQSFA